MSTDDAPTPPTAGFTISFDGRPVRCADGWTIGAASSAWPISRSRRTGCGRTFPDNIVSPLAIVDADGIVLQSTMPLLPETGRMFGEHIQATSTGNAASHALSWQGAGEEWHGVLTHLTLVDERVTTVPWAVVAAGSWRDVSSLARTTVWALLPYGWASALIVAWLGASTSCAGMCRRCERSRRACGRSRSAASNG